MASKKITNVAAAKKTAEKKARKVVAAVAAPAPVADEVEAADLKFYTVLRPIHHGEDRYAPDELIELDEAEAAHLLKTKAIEPFVDEAEPVAEATE